MISLVLALLWPLPSGVPVPSSGAAATGSAPVVILVHGYAGDGALCPGFDVAGLWDVTSEQLTSRLGVQVLPVSYYKCDRHGVDITGSGPGTRVPLTMTSGASYPRAGYTMDTSITRIARDLAWFIHNELTTRGKRVYVVGHSMGGLIIREALRRVQAGDRQFPRSMDVRRVLTISTPHAGWESSCNKNTQCREMNASSSFISDLRSNAAPQGSVGTRWWAMGTDGDLVLRGSPVPCDGIPIKSATAVGGGDLVYTTPCYRHNQYLNDDSDKLDAEGSASLGRRHSVAMMVRLFG